MTATFNKLTLGPLFACGQLLATPPALAAMAEAGADIQTLLRRHLKGDWGVVCDDDKAANDLAVTDGSRILSAYLLPTGVKVWIITEADRSATTLLLPDDY